MATVRIKVSPKILHWVQENTDVVLNSEWNDRINKWLREESNPTLNQIKGLSKKTQIPFGYFFLDDIPKENLPLLKFRTIDNIDIEKPSRNLIDTIHDMEIKQSWLSEYREKNGYPTSSFSHGYNLFDRSDHKTDELITRDIMHVLNLELGWNTGLKNRGAFNLLRDKLDQVGVIVMYSGIVGNNTHRPLSQIEFRAFALDDKFAPLIFINSNDSYNAMLFSLVHELTHIWYGTSELYNDDFQKNAKALNPKTEQDINHISESIIFPKSLFINEWKKQSDGTTIEQIKDVATYFNASPLSSGIRALRLGLIKQTDVDQLKIELSKEHQNKKKGQKGGGDYYTTKAAQTDSAFAREIERGVSAGDIAFNKAFELLGVRNGPAFDKLLSKIKEKGVRR